MVNFFIGRPIFATVLALLMLLVGGICLIILPISQYPEITPAQVQVTTTYTGADAGTVAETVTTPIEQQINGVKGVIYFSSESTSNGASNIVATFDVGYSQDIGAVDIQNRVQTAEASLPPEVKQFGVTIKKTSTDMVCVVNLVSPNGQYDSTYLDNYAQIYVVDVLKRIAGVSDVSVFGRKYAMRIWLDPDRMAAQLITPTEIVTAIQGENRQAAAGKIGGQPAPPGLVFEYPILTRGRLTTVAEFEEITVRRRDDGSIVQLGDVARIQLDSENYETSGWLSGSPAGTLPIYQYSDANALDIVKRVRESMDRLSRNFPPGLEYRIAYDTTKYVNENIVEVQETLYEALLLVLLVVFIFLQGVRATLIPMLAIPVSLVATFAMMAAFGLSINTLTLCGLVLAIGLVVDDAIIVVENVEKFLERGERPLAAVRAAMAEITAPIVTITLVLAAVFVPVAFIPGLTGKLYNQFALTIVFAFVLSAINSLTFSPAMSRLFLRPKHGEAKFFLFRWFNHGMRWLENSYDVFLDFTAHHWWTVVIPSVALLALTYVMLAERPKAFIPTEDQGYLIAAIQTPDGTGREATSRIARDVSRIALGRDLRLMSLNDASEIPTRGSNLIVVAVVQKVLHIRIFDVGGEKVLDADERMLPAKAGPFEDLRRQLEGLWPPHQLARSEKERVIAAIAPIAGHQLTLDLEGVSDVVLLDGFNVLNSTNQANSAVAFVTLKEWSERRQPELRANAMARKLQEALSREVSGAVILVLEPPPIRGLSQTGGFEFMIEDRDGKGVEALATITDQFLEEARKRDKDGRPAHPELAAVFTPFSARVPQLRFDFDRTKAERLDVSVSDVFSVLQANLGGLYVNDFNLYGKVWKVMVQAEGKNRAKPDDIRRLYVLNRQGKRVPLGSLGDVRYTLRPIDVPHYNLYNAAKINGQPALGFSSGQAIAAMERIADTVLPEGFSYEWTGTTFQEQKTGNVAGLIFGLSIVCVFLFMAALYESWIRPLVIIFTVPLAMFGAILGLWIYGMPLDVFGQIGLVMLIGLETKNAILIVEFGVELQHKQGMSIIDSAKEAARQRLRPILMTSFAFVMGVLPMARATGAGAYSRNSLGVVIAFGMIVSTILGRFVIPVYYVLGERLIARFRRDTHEEEPSSLEGNDDGDEAETS